MSTHKLQRTAITNTTLPGKERCYCLLQSIPDWVWEMDANNHYTFSSPSVFNLLGYTPEEVIGRSPLDFMPPDEARRSSLNSQR